MNTGAFKRFTIAVLRFACGIALAALIIGLVVWGIVAFREASETAANAPLANLKAWPEVTALPDTRCRLQTVWRTVPPQAAPAGTIYYQFDLQGYPPELRQAREHANQAAFTINFLDKDGFRLFQHQLALSEMTQVVGTDGQTDGLSWKGDEFMTVDLYRRAAGWEIIWSGFSAVSDLKPAAPSAPSIPLRNPARPAGPRWRNVSLWRGLSHGMSQDDVRRILGAPEKVSDLGFQVTWYYGYPLGGEVTFGKDGKAESWSEP